MLLESDDSFLMSRFYFFDYLSFLNFLNGGFAILIKMVTYSHNARMVSNLAIIDSIFLVLDEEVWRRFSLIARFFTILIKNSLNVLANSPSS